MKTTYEQNYQIELINELSWGVCGLFFNDLLKRKINVEDKNIFEVQLLEQLEEMKATPLSDKTVDELIKIKEYWEIMSTFTKELFNKKTVA